MVYEIWWKDDCSFRWMREQYSRIEEALNRVKWLKTNELEVNEEQHRTVRRVPLSTSTKPSSTNNVEYPQ